MLHVRALRGAPPEAPLANHGVTGSNLWIAEELWNLGAIELGDFTLGRTAVHSPIYVNVRRLISSPMVLDRCAMIMNDELEALLAMRNAPVQPFGLVCGVPFGGLHLGTAYSLRTAMPMIYIHPSGKEREAMIEGVYRPGQTCLIIDDLVTGGGSILDTARHLRDFGLYVHDAIALVDRQEGGRRQLKEAGVNLTSVLTMEQIANYLRSQGHIDAEWHRKIMDYIAAANE